MRAAGEALGEARTASSLGSHHIVSLDTQSSTDHRNPKWFVLPDHTGKYPLICGVPRKYSQLGALVICRVQEAGPSTAGSWK